jgi:hypothetical protein
MDSPAPVFGPPSSFSASLGRVPTDEERSRDLTRIKIIATTLLVFSVVLAFAARLLETRQWSLGYVAAWAEAAAVGGLADWYAVVALFRHPCGIPLPHTAIISSNREHIAESFGDFVEEQFLAPDPIEQKLKSVDFAAAAAEWLADEERSVSLSRFALRLLPQALSAVEETGLQSFMAQHVVEQIEAFEVAEMSRRWRRFARKFAANCRRCSACSAPTLIYCTGSSPSLQVSSMKRRAIPTMPCATTSTGSSGISSKSWAPRQNTPTGRRR